MPRRLVIQGPGGVARLNLMKGRKVANTNKSHFLLVSLMCDSATSAEFATSRGRTVADSGKSRLMDFRCAATQRPGCSMTSPIAFWIMKWEFGHSVKHQPSFAWDLHWGRSRTASLAPSTSLHALWICGKTHDFWMQNDMRYPIASVHICFSMSVPASNCSSIRRKYLQRMQSLSVLFLLTMGSCITSHRRKIHVRCGEYLYRWQ